jgi:hypothetical protein
MKSPKAEGKSPMKSLLVVATLFVVAAPTAHASTVENALFTCFGELTKTQIDNGKTYYGIIESWKDRADLPMDCDIKEGKVLRQILAVCHVGSLCTVAEKGEEGNGNRHFIEKVFEVQRQPASFVERFKRDAKQ